MKKRKLIAGLFVATAALGLASCTNNDKPVDPEPTPEVTKYTVTFNSNGGSNVASITVDANGKITLPKDPTKADNTFGGWFTDSACTKAFDANTAITANITLYAKWTAVAKDPDADKIKIADADDFIAMLKGEFEEVAVGSGLVEEYILTADIDFKDVTDLGAELGQTAYSFSGVLDGRGYTISNLKLIRQKKQVGLFEGVFAGTIKNLNFKDVEVSNAPVDTEGNALTDDCRGVSLFGNYAAGGAAFENIAIDGFKVYTNADSSKVEESAGFVVNCFDTVYLENIAITGMDVTMGKNSGAVLGAMRVTTDTLKVAGVEVADKTACVIEAKNILLEGNIKGTTADSQGLGGLIGRCDNTEDGQMVNVDGFVFKGTITGTKNNGPLIGNVKQTGTVVNVKNAYALAGGIASDGTLQGTANVFAGQFKAEEYSFENCFYVDRLYNTQKTKDGATSSLGYLDPEIAAPIKASEITAITDAFTVADGKITLNGLSVEIPTDVTVADTAASTVTVNGATPTITDGVITITGEVPYWHAASNAGAAGNFVEVKLVAAEGVTTTGSFYVLNTTCSYENASEMSIYVPVAALAEGQTAYPDAKIQVRWNNAAKDEVYTIKFASDITFEAAPVYGAISQDTAGLTAANPVVDTVTDNFTLDYTAGEIAWDNDGNYVTVKVAQPTWVETPAVVVSTGATLVSCESGVATIKVKVKATGANFTVQWTADTDAQAYAITLNGATLQADPGASVPTASIEYDGSAATNPDFVITQATAGSSRFASLAEGAAKVDADGVSLTKLAVTTDYVETVAFRASKSAKVEVLGGTTSSSNAQIFKIEALNAAGEVVATVYSAPSMPSKVLGYMLDAENNKYVEIKSTTEFVKIKITATGDKATVGDGGMSGKNWCPATIKVTYTIEPVVLEYDGSAATNASFAITQATAGSSRFASLAEGAAKVDADGVSLTKLAVTTDYVETVAFRASKSAKVEVLGGTTSSSNAQIFKIEALNAAGEVVATVYSAPSMPSKVLGYMLDAENNKYVEIKSTTEFVKIRITATGDKATVGDGGMSGKNWCPATIKVTAQ